MTEADMDVLMDHIESKVLPEKFGHQTFREGQREIIRNVLSGRSCLAVLPTGAGKSLLYMLPSQLLDGITVVVSPLLALMRDQVEALRSQNIAAVRIDGSMSREEVLEAMRAINSGNVRVLYISPERFNNEAFNRFMAGTSVAMFVVDEAHCISEWGHAFRPDYLRLSHFATISKAKVRLALTATATTRVARDIVDKLGIQASDCLRLPSLRTNIKLNVRALPWPNDGYEQRFASLLSFLSSLPTIGAAIVYVNRQRLAERVAADLLASGYDARAYHAGMDSDERKAVESWFLTDEGAAGRDGHQRTGLLGKEGAPIVVGTVAFGMGIDKRDIRSVVHFDLPRSVEDYVQGVGRAGRDGLEARCLALWAQSDEPALRSQICGSTPSLAAFQQLVASVFHGPRQGRKLPGADKDKISSGSSGSGSSSSSSSSGGVGVGESDASSPSPSPSASPSLSGYQSTADPSLYLSYYDLANAFDVSELPLRLAMSHLVQLGLVAELTPVYGIFKAGMLDKARLAAFLQSLAEPAAAGAEDDGGRGFDGESEGGGWGEAEGDGGLGRRLRWMGLCRRVSSHLLEQEASSRKKKWHTIDTIALGNALDMRPNQVVMVLSDLCRAQVCDSGGLSRIYSRFRLLQPVNAARISTAVHQHALEIQRRALARMLEIVALLREGAQPGASVWAQIGTYFDEEDKEEKAVGEAQARRPAARTAPVVLPFDMRAWDEVERLVRAGAVPHDDPALIARFATGVPSPRMARLKLSRAEAFGCAAACEWEECLARAAAMCDELRSPLQSRV